MIYVANLLHILWCSFQYKIAILIERACDNGSGDEEVSQNMF